MNADGYFSERDNPETILPCETCRYKSHPLNPKGCYHKPKVSDGKITGVVGLLMHSINDCKFYRRDK